GRGAHERRRTVLAEDLGAEGEPGPKQRPSTVGASMVAGRTRASCGGSRATRRRRRTERPARREALVNGSGQGTQRPDAARSCRILSAAAARALSFQRVSKGTLTPLVLWSWR